MNIVYCIQSTYNSGGMERVLANKVNWLANQGHEILIATTDQMGRASFYDFDNRVRCIDLGINYSQNKQRPIWKKFGYYFYNRFIHKRRLRMLIKHEHPDIIISWISNETTFLPHIAGTAKLVAECHFCHYFFTEFQQQGWHRILNKYSFRLLLKELAHYHRFIVLTEKDRLAWHLQNAVVIPNARTYEPKCQTDYKNKHVLAIGRLTAQKGFDMLIEIWEKVATRYPDWILDIYGDGPDKAKLEKAINKYSLHEKVCIHAPTSNIQSAYISSSIFALPSRYEGFPMVMLEAQAYGLPIVAFDCPCGPSDILKDEENGYLIKTGEYNVYANRLMQLMDNYELRKTLGERAYKDSLKYKQEDIMMKWQTLFSQLVE